MILTPYLTVQSMEKSMAFYTAFFGQEPDMFCPGRFVVYDAGNTKLSLYSPDYDEQLIASGADLSGKFNAAYLERKGIPLKYGNHIVLNFGVDNLTAEYNRVRGLDIGLVSDIMYINIAAPYYCFTVYDPDGNCLEITGRYENVQS